MFGFGSLAVDLWLGYLALDLWLGVFGLGSGILRLGDPPGRNSAGGTRPSDRKIQRLKKLSKNPQGKPTMLYLKSRVSKSRAAQPPHNPPLHGTKLVTKEW